MLLSPAGERPIWSGGGVHLPWVHRGGGGSVLPPPRAAPPTPHRRQVRRPAGAGTLGGAGPAAPRREGAAMAETTETGTTRRGAAGAAYLLRSDAEGDRLRLQARVWEPAAEALLDAVGVRPGGACAD